ncbi:MoaD/ThiS family protein [Alkalicoccobacillus porphyridii]|uniref:Molybdopterin synthase sulfur carrier subunit n=1 Tax=Alkalicoccobacillus porphyridii TaxID=2597270 RepID=A0A553ZV68_9BACI|nr:MoaD/ThiS family protein [Alkalicoccobacillus porphyridii]TSB45359.1 MoaD/ThiS family protein [Alkalicoccobacillus porphyridii]
MIQIKLFAQLEEQVGEHILEYTYDSKEINELLKELESSYNINLESVMVAVNEEYAERTTVVRSGDVLALIPPVSGG